MIEKYVLNELDKYKIENAELKSEINRLRNKFIVMVDETPKRGELISIETIIKILEENNIEPKKIVDDMGSDEIRDIILNLKLYKEKSPKKYDSSREKDLAVIKIGNYYYSLEKYYSDYKLEERVYITWSDEVYNELVDELYDKLNEYIRKQAKENK